MELLPHAKVLIHNYRDIGELRMMGCTCILQISHATVHCRNYLL